METKSNMSSEEFEIATRLCESDPEFKDLWEEHQLLKEKLENFKSKSFLTSEEEMEMKKIKRLKLLGKDKIALKIKEYKVAVTPG